MNIIVLILILVLLFGGIGTLPTWGHNWGWGPSGGIGLLLVILVILALTGRL